MVVVWTDYARESAAHILEFVCKCWGDPMAMTVWESVQNDASLLGYYPQLGSVYSVFKYKSQDINIRELVVNKKNKLFYLVYGESVYILLLWDTRANPQKLKRLLASLSKKIL